MTDTAIRMKDELLKLGSQDRAALAHFLIETLDVEEEEDVEEAWHEEIVRRSAQIAAGTAVGDPADQVFKALREKFS
ncbi:MAG: addiction module protein [Pirellulaceae bacterium]|nr:addiction module protein [Pirellulaceae bacterium]